MINVTALELEAILTTLDKALIMHDQWREEIQRSLICKLPPEPANLAQDAHKLCAFGRWYYGAGNAHLRRLETFQKVEEMHMAVHALGRDLCTHVKGHWAITVKEYDPFVAQINAFRGELIKLRLKVEETLHTIDALTGAYISSQLLPHLKREQQAMKANGRPYSLLLLHFELGEFNRIYGHDKGNGILRNSLTIIRHALGPDERVYRYTGAEFVVCMPGKTADEAHALREQLLTKVSEALAGDPGQESFELPLRFGIVDLDPNAYLEHLISQAAMATLTIQL